MKWECNAKTYIKIDRQRRNQFPLKYNNQSVNHVLVCYDGVSQIPVTVDEIKLYIFMHVGMDVNRWVPNISI